MKFHSIKFKLSILYTSLLGMLFITYAFYLYSSLRTALIDDFDSGLKIKSQHVQSFLKKFYLNYADDSASQEEAFREAIDMTMRLDQFARGNEEIDDIKINWLKYFDLLDLSEDRIHFFNPHNHSSIATHNLTNEEQALLIGEINKREPQNTYFSEINMNNEKFRVIQEPFTLGDGIDCILQIATSEKTALALLEERKNTLIFSVPLILFLAILIGRIFANQLIKPLVKVADAAERISYKDLCQKVTSKYRDEEVSTLVNAFNNMLSRLERSFRHITDFNSHVSHELKTPIAIISGECEVALRKDQTLSEYKETLSAIYEEAQKMLRITEDLLLLAKLDYNHNVFKSEEFNLHKFFSDLYQSIEKARPAKEHHLSLNLPEDDVVIKGDPVHLRRLYMNIIGNAIKFTPNDGSIVISVLIKDKDLIVKIRDTGAGINEADVKNIFNQFYQKTPAALRMSQGNGLGLSIAQSIAKIHSGEIRVESVAGKGSTFTVILPIIISGVTSPKLAVSRA